MNEEVRREQEDKLKLAGELINEICNNYITSPELIAEALAFSSKFYKYSLENQMLIKHQNRGACYVQSFAVWKEMGYQVNKGEHGMMIRVPVKIIYLEVPLKDLTPQQLAFHTAHSDNTQYAYIQYMYATKAQQLQYKSNLIGAKTELAFKIGTVFDIAQTNCPKEDYPKFFDMGYSSEEHHVIFKGLVDYYEHMGHKVVIDDIQSIALKGYYDPHTKNITLNKMLEDTQTLSTLSHELGHFLHDHGSKSPDKPASLKEFEADCISVIIQSYYGIELTDSRKIHLSDHFHEVKREISTSLEDDERNKLSEYLKSALSESMQIFRDNIDAIDFYVQKALCEGKGIINASDELVPDCLYEITEQFYNPEIGDIYLCKLAQEAIAVYENLKKQSGTKPGINIRLTYSEAGGLIRRIPILREDRVDLSILNSDERSLLNDAGIMPGKFLKYITTYTRYKCNITISNQQELGEYLDNPSYAISS